MSHTHTQFHLPDLRPTGCWVPKAYHARIRNVSTCIAHSRTHSETGWQQRPVPSWRQSAFNRRQQSLVYTSHISRHSLPVSLASPASHTLLYNTWHIAVIGFSWNPSAHQIRKKTKQNNRPQKKEKKKNKKSLIDEDSASFVSNTEALKVLTPAWRYQRLLHPQISFSYKYIFQVGDIMFILFLVVVHQNQPGQPPPPQKNTRTLEVLFHTAHWRFAAKDILLLNVAKLTYFVTLEKGG